jgi:PrtD family type I secretion system ABC transporter
MIPFFKSPVGVVLFTQARVLWASFILTFVIEVAAITPILYMLNTYDRVMSSRSFVTLVSITAVMVLVFLFSSLLEWLRAQVLIRLALKLDWELAPDVFDAAYRSQLRRQDINIHQLLGDLLSFKQFVSAGPALALMELPIAFFYVGIGFIMHPALAAFTLAAIVVMLITTYLQQRLSSSVIMAANDQFAATNRTASQFLRNVESSYAMGMESAARKLWYESHKKYLELQTSASESAGGIGSFLGLLQKVLPSFALGLGAWLAINDLISASMVFAASMLITKAIAPIQKILGHWKAIIGARQAFHRLNSLLVEYRAQSKGMALPAPSGQLVMEGLSLIPPGHKSAVVAGVSAVLAPGSVTVIVGSMGCGKSSLARGLLGIWAPATGSVRLDGVEMSSWDRDEVGPHVGYVAQDFGFFDGTVAQNIARLGTVDAEQVVLAAQRVGMHEVILNFPQGYNTPLRDGSTFMMSGGQKQRLAIARAIYNTPKLLVLDEPNSALDESGEHLLGKLIRDLSALGTTIVAITHRPALVSLAHNLMVLQAGRMVKFGPTTEVIEWSQNNKAATA